MKIKHIIYLLLLIGIGGLIAYRINKNNNENGSNSKAKNSAPVTVKGMILKPQEFKDNLSLSGSLEANEQVDIRSEVTGVVQSINFDEGSKVNEGQILIKVNDIELRAQLSKVETAQKLASENERSTVPLLNATKTKEKMSTSVLPAWKNSTGPKVALLNDAELAELSFKGPKSGVPIAPKSITVVGSKLTNRESNKTDMSYPKKYVWTPFNDKPEALTVAVIVSPTL